MIGETAAMEFLVHGFPAGSAHGLVDPLAPVAWWGDHRKVIGVEQEVSAIKARVSQLASPRGVFQAA